MGRGLGGTRGSPGSPGSPPAAALDSRPGTRRGAGSGKFLRRPTQPSAGRGDRDFLEKEKGSLFAGTWGSFGPFVRAGKAVSAASERASPQPGKGSLRSWPSEGGRAKQPGGAHLGPCAPAPHAWKWPHVPPGRTLAPSYWTQVPRKDPISKGQWSGPTVAGLRRDGEGGRVAR